MSDAETLCRTCLRPITHETRTEPGYLPREGWYDDARKDAFVCFKSRDYRHVPLSDRERAYYDAGFKRAGQYIGRSGSTSDSPGRPCLGFGVPTSNEEDVR